jgi:GDP-4-dehydro-6-deoxy-D-mannose reductase
MRVLITGAAGFIGGFLVKQSVEAGSPVLGIDIRRPDAGFAGASFEECDVRDSARFLELVSKFRPECIFHLAAQSYPTVSLIRPLETMEANVGGTISLFECLRLSGCMPIVVVACSSAEYGPVEAADLPVREDHALRPLHPYGVSKVAQDLLAAQYFANYAMQAIRIRIFKTTGPGKQGDVCSDIAKRAVEIEMGIRCSPIMEIGNLTTRRTIVDVRDLVRALWLSADHCKAGEVYNIGGDDAHSVQELVELMGELANIEFKVEQRRNLMRSCDEAVVAGDNTKFRSSCEWTPKIPIRTTLRDMLDWWRGSFSRRNATRRKTQESPGAQTRMLRQMGRCSCKNLPSDEQ